MSYEKSLFNGDDPLYAPGLTWSGKKKDTPYWRVTPKYRKLGYPTSSIRLTGKKDDGQDIERARECRKHTRNMLAYFGVDVPKEDMGTWAWLISRYLTDRHSPIRGVKENTRQNYEWCLMRWKAAIGHIRIEQMDYIMLCDLVEGMRENGRSAAYISRMFNRLRAITKYGKMIKAKGAADVSEILNEMRIPMPQRRSVIATREHVRAIVDEADARGMFGFATGLLIQWVYCLRAVDVRGQWLPCDPEAGGIVRKVTSRRSKRHGLYERWQDGLTWDMVSPDLACFNKVMSKTQKSLPEEITFDLTLAPELQQRLKLLANRSRVGPVITKEKDNHPYTVGGWSRAWKRIRDSLDLPENIWMMDTRAGGISEASALGADPYVLRNAAQHMNVNTTDRYVRGRSESVSKIVQLRAKS